MKTWNDLNFPLHIYSRVPIRRHGTFIQHTSFIRPNTFPKKWAMPYNRISMSNWSTFRYKFVWINLHLLYRPRHPCLLFGTVHEASGDPCLIFHTPLVIGTREHVDLLISITYCLFVALSLYVEELWAGPSL